MIKLTNPNYCATVVQINNIIPIEKANNIQHAIIMGNSVIVSKNVNIGDIDLFFPVESQLSSLYLSCNNLYREKELNIDKTKSGFFELNGRVRCVKLIGNKSEGLFMPLNSLNNLNIGSDLDIDLKVGDEFNIINNIEICKKYTLENIKTSEKCTSKKEKKPKKSIIIENQFRFHMDTNQLYKNLHKINPYDLISISYKIHGTSGISSKILINKELKWYDKLLIKLGVSVETTKYSLISASRTVIKSETSDGGFYGEDIWKIASNYLKDHITNGMTLYYEICGFTPSGKHIQKGYDYGCIKPTNNQYIEGYNYKIYIYRITLTNVDGKVFEFSSKQVQDWCYSKGLKPVPELYYGFANDVLPANKYELSEWRNYFLNYIKNKYNDKKCFMCKNIVPEEGVVIRIENLEFNAFKCKSEDFYLRETKQLDNGEIDIETIN